MWEKTCHALKLSKMQMKQLAKKKMFFDRKKGEKLMERSGKMTLKFLQSEQRREKATVGSFQLELYWFPPSKCIFTRASFKGFCTNFLHGRWRNKIRFFFHCASFCVAAFSCHEAYYVLILCALLFLLFIKAFSRCLEICTKNWTK